MQDKHTVISANAHEVCCAHEVSRTARNEVLNQTFNMKRSSPHVQQNTSYRQVHHILQQHIICRKANFIEKRTSSEVRFSGWGGWI